jgi:hypothetical protein
MPTPASPSLRRQRESRTNPTIRAVEAPPHTPRNVVRDLVRRFSIFVRLVEIDASLQFHSDWVEVPNRAVQLFRRQIYGSHGVEEVGPFDLTWCGGDAWGEEDGLEDFEGASVHRKSWCMIVIIVFGSVLDISLGLRWK